MKRILAGLAALAVAALIWLPCLHLFFSKPVSDFRQAEGLSPKARELAARHLQLWTDPALREAELKKMRVSNAEWDFMGRSYLVWSLANMSLRDPASKPLYLRTMDQIIDETLRLEKTEGMYFFLMPYAKDRRYLAQPAHSLVSGRRNRPDAGVAPDGRGKTGIQTAADRARERHRRAFPEKPAHDSGKLSG